VGTFSVENLYRIQHQEAQIAGIASLVEFAVRRLDAGGDDGKGLEIPEDFETAQAADRRKLSIGIRLEPTQRRFGFETLVNDEIFRSRSSGR
jgi:hypothetical protein